MKNRFHFVLSIALVLIISISGMQVFAIDESVHYNPEAEADELYMMIHSSLAEELGYEIATNHMRSSEALFAFVSGLPESRTGELIYPSGFGGAYVDEQGDVVILHVEDYRHRTMDDSLVQLQSSSGGTVRYVEFSYNELWETIHYLNESILDAGIDLLEINVHGWYLDVINNRVVVRLVGVQRGGYS